MMDNERNVLLKRIELIGEDYELTDYINFKLEKLGYNSVSQTTPNQLVDLYDALLLKIYQ